MPDFVQQEVRELCDGSESDELVTLLLGVEKSMSSVRRLVEDLGGHVDEELPFNTLRANLPKRAVGELYDANNITSIEIEEKGETLPAGNF